MNILLVDDNELDRELVLAHLNDTAARVFEADSVAGAIQVMEREEQVDLVIVDMRLRNGLGSDILEYLKTKRNDVPAIVASAYPGHRAEMGDRPLTYWLDKPLRREALWEALGKAVLAGNSTQTLRQAVTHLSGFLQRWGGA